MSLSDRVITIVCEKLEVANEKVKLEASFADLGADCLDMLEMMMMLEDDFNVSIPEEEAENIRTVGDAVRYIEDHLGG